LYRRFSALITAGAPTDYLNLLRDPSPSVWADVDRVADLKLGHEILLPYPSKFVTHSSPLNRTFVSDLFLTSFSLNKLKTLIKIVAFGAFVT
jgi:hypothetical protein